MAGLKRVMLGRLRWSDAHCHTLSSYAPQRPKVTPQVPSSVSRRIWRGYLFFFFGRSLPQNFFGLGFGSNPSTGGGAEFTIFFYFFGFLDKLAIRPRFALTTLRYLLFTLKKPQFIDFVSYDSRCLLLCLRLALFTSTCPRDPPIQSGMALPSRAVTVLNRWTLTTRKWAISRTSLVTSLRARMRFSRLV